MKLGLFAIVPVLALPLPAGASVGLEGAEPFSFAAWFMNPSRLGQVATMRVAMRGSYVDSVRGEAHIVLPLGMQLVSGDTLRRAHPARGDAEWVVQVIPTTIGPQDIRGSLRIDDVGGLIDEAEFILPLEVRADTVLVGGSRLTRAEHIRGAQRFRYGGEYLVPIDGPEPVRQGDITAKPRVVERPSAVDSLGRLAATARIPFVAFIDREGRLRDARLRGGSRNAYVEGLAKDALRRWTFAPAIAKGRPVSDWLEVRVEVVPKQ